MLLTQVDHTWDIKIPRRHHRAQAITGYDHTIRYHSCTPYKENVIQYEAKISYHKWFVPR